MSYLSSHKLLRVGRHVQATNAAICGDVTLGDDVSVWFSVTIRGDVAPVSIGARTNIQDGCVLHCDSGKPLTIAEDVTIGHGAVVHCSKIGRGSLIGIKSVLLGDVVVGEECMIAAGAVLSPGLVVPDRHVVMGVPGKVVRPIRDSELEWIRNNCKHYVELSSDHAAHPEKYYR